MPSSDFRLRAALLLCSAWPALAQAQTPPEYALTFLGAANGVSGISENGWVIGQRSVGSATRGFIVREGQSAVLLPLAPGDQSSFALDVNELGQVVGAVSSFTSPEFSGRAALWSPNGQGGYTLTLLGQLPGHSGSTATAINNLGDVVGYSNQSWFRYPVWFNSPTGLFDLNPLGVFDPQAINDERVFCDSQGKLCDLDTLQVVSLGLPSGPPTYSAAAALDINQRGDVAGRVVLATSTSCVYQAARYLDGIGWQMLTPCSSNAGAYAINGRGDVVYTAALIYPFLHLEGLGDFDVQSLLAPAAAGWDLLTTGGLQINSQRQIACWALDPSTGQVGAVLLKPTWTVQTDVGLAGPGKATLSVTGGDLSSGTQADLLLTGGSANQGCLLFVGDQLIALPLLAGVLGPLPIATEGPLPLNASGTLLLPNLNGGQGPLSLYVQALYAAPSLPFGVGFSNTVRLDFLP
jgi:hypothetical protein